MNWQGLAISGRFLDVWQGISMLLDSLQKNQERHHLPLLCMTSQILSRIKDC